MPQGVYTSGFLHQHHHQYACVSLAAMNRFMKLRDRDRSPFLTPSSVIAVTFCGFIRYPTIESTSGICGPRIRHIYATSAGGTTHISRTMAPFWPLGKNLP